MTSEFTSEGNSLMDVPELVYILSRLIAPNQHRSPTGDTKRPSLDWLGRLVSPVLYKTKD